MRSLWMAAIGIFLCAVGWCVVEQVVVPQDALSGTESEQLLLAIGRDGEGRLTPDMLVGGWPADMPVPETAGRAIRHAALSVGADTRYLVAVAARESSFDPSARAARTSAVGLYQFTEETWLRVVKLFGARHGLAAYAAEIAIGEDGDVSMPPGAARRRLMQLRRNADLSAVMAAELARDNQARLERMLGRPVTPAETYIAHFLGVRQAARIIAAAHATPHLPAARLLPAAAVANPSLFTGPSGETVSAAAIVDAVDAYFRRPVPRFAGA